MWWDVESYHGIETTAWGKSRVSLLDSPIHNFPPKFQGEENNWLERIEDCGAPVSSQRINMPEGTER
jgi:hypothetical protein